MTTGVRWPGFEKRIAISPVFGSIVFHPLIGGQNGIRVKCAHRLTLTCPVQLRSVMQTGQDLWSLSRQFVSCE
jgi:hypothetical protein